MSNPDLKDSFDLYSKYLDKETNELSEKFKAMIAKIDDKINEELRKKMKKNRNSRNMNMSIFINPKIIKNISEKWELLFRNHNLIEENSKENKSLLDLIERLQVDLPRIGVQKTEAYLESFQDLDNSQSNLYIDQAENIYVVRMFIEKSLEQNSFYQAVGFAYLEQLATESSPFNLMYQFITKLKSKVNFQFISPQSQKTSFKNDGILKIENLPNYFIDQLMRFSEQLWLNQKLNNSGLKKKMIEEFEILFQKNKAFQLAILLHLRTEAAEYFESKNNLKGLNNVIDLKLSPSIRTIKAIAKILEVTIEVYDFDKDEDEKNKAIIAEPDMARTQLKKIILFKYKEVYHIAYEKKYSKTRFPKAYEINKTKKKDICSFCYREKGKTYNKCEDNYCLECLNLALQKSQGNVVKCEKCRKCLGNKENLLSTSKIKKV